MIKLLPTKISYLGFDEDENNLYEEIVAELRDDDDLHQDNGNRLVKNNEDVEDNLRRSEYDEEVRTTD